MIASFAVVHQVAIRDLLADIALKIQLLITVVAYGGYVLILCGRHTWHFKVFRNVPRQTYVEAISISIMRYFALQIPLVDLAIPMIVLREDATRSHRSTRPSHYVKKRSNVSRLGRIFELIRIIRIVFRYEGGECEML